MGKRDGASDTAAGSAGTEESRGHMIGAAAAGAGAALVGMSLPATTAAAAAGLAIMGGPIGVAAVAVGASLTWIASRLAKRRRDHEAQARSEDIVDPIALPIEPTRQSISSPAQPEHIRQLLSDHFSLLLNEQRKIRDHDKQEHLSYLQEKDRKNLQLNLLLYFLGVSTPLVLKYQFGLG